MKRIVMFLFIGVLLLTSCSTSVLPADWNSSEQEEAAIQGQDLFKYKDNIYFSISTTDMYKIDVPETDGLYKIDVPETDGLYKIVPSGEALQVSNYAITNIFVINDIFYGLLTTYLTNSSDLPEMNNDLVKINADGSGYKVINHNVSAITRYDEPYLYFTKTFVEYPDVDPAEVESPEGIFVHDEYFKMDVPTEQITQGDQIKGDLSGGLVYYITEEETLCCENPDGSNQIFLAEDVTRIDKHGNYFFYGDSKSIYIIKRDGSGRKKIINSDDTSSGFSSGFSVVGDYLYLNADKLYRINFTNRKKEKIAVTIQPSSFTVVCMDLYYSDYFHNLYKLEYGSLTPVQVYKSEIHSPF